MKWGGGWVALYEGGIREIVMTDSKKRNSIVLGYAGLGTVLYLVSSFIVQGKIDKDVSAQNGLVNNILLALVYSSLGFWIFLTIMNLAPIIGLLLAKRIEDKVATSTFGGLTLVAIMGSVVLIYLVYN